MGIKEHTCHDEHCVMYKIVESLNCTWETNITLYVKNNRIKIKNLIGNISIATGR